MKNLFIHLFAASLLLVACTTENAPGIDPVVPPTVDRVPLVVESARVNAEASTRATTPLNTGSIGIYLWGAGYTAQLNRQYTYSGSSWVPNSAAATIYLGGAAASVSAYYPYNQSFTSSTVDISSKIMNSTDDDLLFSPPRTVSAAPLQKTTSFLMDHVYGKLSFVFQRNNYSGSCLVSKIEVKNLKKNTEADFRYDSPVSPLTGDAGTTLSMACNTTVSSSGTTAESKSFLLLPCTPALTGMEIELIVDGKVMSVIVSTASYKPTKNEHKTITLTISSSALIVTGVEVTNWIPSDLAVTPEFI